MATPQSNRNAKIIEREIELITQLHSKAIENGELDSTIQDSYARFVQYKQERLSEIQDAEVATGHLVQLANDVADLRMQQRTADSALIKRSQLFYSVASWPTDLLTELRILFQRMELAHREGDIFLFGGYVMRQVEAVANYHITTKIGLASVSRDMHTVLASRSNTSKKLVEWIVTGPSFRSQQTRTRFRQPNYIATNDDFDLMVKIKYLFWYYLQKPESKTPYLKFEPFNYLTTARNKSSHGYFQASTPEEQTRHDDMESNPSVYFIEFYAILNELRVAIK